MKILIEDMTLNTLSAKDKLKKVVVIPWQILGIDSAPCIVLAVVKLRSSLQLAMKKTRMNEGMKRKANYIKANRR